MKHKTYLSIAKENLKFSSSHFLIFDEKTAEMLHGHNYQVSLKVYPKEGIALPSTGYFIDFAVIKKLVKALCDEWDEHVLIPQKNSEMKISDNSQHPNYDIIFRDRFYSFPKKETVLLPITNTSVELLSELFGRKLIQKMEALGISAAVGRLKIAIEETSGQSATTEFSV